MFTSSSYNTKSYTRFRRQQGRYDWSKNSSWPGVIHGFEACTAHGPGVSPFDLLRRGRLRKSACCDGILSSSSLAGVGLEAKEALRISGLERIVSPQPSSQKGDQPVLRTRSDAMAAATVSARAHSLSSAALSLRSPTAPRSSGPLFPPVHAPGTHRPGGFRTRVRCRVAGLDAGDRAPGGDARARDERRDDDRPGGVDLGRTDRGRGDEGGGDRLGSLADRVSEKGKSFLGLCFATIVVLALPATFGGAQMKV